MSLYFKPKMLIIMILGITSGLPLALSGSTLSAMLMDSGISMTNIAIFGLVSTPYAFKYLWSPLVDNLNLPILGRILGRRRSWLIFTQIFLFSSIIFIGLYARQTPDLLMLGISTFCMSFFSATQDIVIDAYRIEILREEEQGFGAAVAIFGYRIGMLLSGAGSFFIAEYFSWSAAYLLSAFFLIPGGLAALFYGEPAATKKYQREFNNIKDWLKHGFIDPFLELMKMKNWLIMIALILLYKLSDAYIGMLTTPFLLDIGFSKIEIASIIKLYGFLATMLGMFLGGYLISKCGNIFVILIFGLILQCLSNLSFVIQATYGYDISILITVISIENFCSGISGAALVAYISTIVKREFTATHYAILSSLAVFGSTTISSSAGKVVSLIGWTNFFYFSALLSLPAFFCLYYLYYKKK